MFYAIPTKGISLEATENSLAEELSALASEGITGKELQRIKKVLCMSHPLKSKAMGWQSMHMTRFIM